MNSSEKNQQLSNSKFSSDYYNNIDLAKERRKTNPFKNKNSGMQDAVLMACRLFGYAFSI